MLHAALFATSLVLSVPGLAQDEAGSATINHKQLAECMTRRMTADRLLSYNEAAKACRNLLLKARKETAANVSNKPVS